MILANIPTKVKVGVVVTIIALAGSFYLGMSYTQSKWDREKALELAYAKKTLENSLVQSYSIGKVFEQSQHATQVTHDQIQKGISQLNDPCGYSADWWLLHDAAALNRATAIVPDAGPTRKP